MVRQNIKYRRLTFLGYALFIFVSLALAILLTSEKTGTIDWLNQSDWSHFTGTEKTDYGIRVFPTGRAINHRDTSTAQPNPPVNIRSSHLKISGDFQIDMKLSDIHNDATVQFYGQVPVVYDEWRQERPSIRLDAKKDGLYVRIWDGTAANSIDEIAFPVELKNEINIGVIRTKDTFIIQVDGKTLGRIPDHKIFASGTIWFGADAKVGTEGWTLHTLKARGSKKDNVVLSDAPNLAARADSPDSLRGLSRKTSRKIPIGVAVSANSLFTDEKYREIALTQFSMITPENSLKPQSIHPQKDLYTFGDADSMVEIAQNNQMLVHGHALVMGKANPEWMQKTPIEERKQVMIDHISTVMGRYKGRIAQWDVVNEPLSEDDIDYNSESKGIRKHMWSDALGEEYIDIAYKTARAADPEAKLYLNDFGLEKEGKRWDAFLSLVKRLQARGVPIDGVGFESHVYHAPADTIDASVLKQHIRALASLGIDSRISEIDVLGDDPTFQAKQYADVLSICLEEPSCTSYGVWGITDLYGSTTLSDRYPIILGDSLLWDTDYAPKPALKNIQEVLALP